MNFIFVLFFLIISFSSHAEVINQERFENFINKVVPTEKKIIAQSGDYANKNDIQDSSILYFFVQNRTGRIYDVTKEDIFTKEEQYSHSMITCLIEVIYFTPVLNQKIAVSNESGNFSLLTINLSGPKGEMIFDMYVGGIFSTEVIETSENQINYGVTEGRSHFSIGEFETRLDAENSLESSCDLSEFDKIKLYDYHTQTFTDGILMQGHKDRIPFVNGSTWFLFN